MMEATNWRNSAQKAANCLIQMLKDEPSTGDKSIQSDGGCELEVKDVAEMSDNDDIVDGVYLDQGHVWVE